MKRLILSLVLFAPIGVFAQQSDLAAQIRADLMTDPRTAQMSGAELNALVAALAQEAQETGAAETYLDAKSAPTFTYDPPPVSSLTPLQATLMSPLVLAILALILALIGLAVMLLRRKHAPEPEIPMAPVA